MLLVWGLEFCTSEAIYTILSAVSMPFLALMFVWMSRFLEGFTHMSSISAVKGMFHP